MKNHVADFFKCGVRMVYESTLDEIVEIIFKIFRKSGFQNKKVQPVQAKTNQTVIPNI